MPLVRFQVRNEYGLGQPELYREANREDPKQVLDGVAVAGLVGILRQLGDLAEFAAEVFHGLQEQVTTTASRSHKLMVRVQQIEAALPPIEKAVLAQTSHIHFAYTAGSEWHPRIKNEQNHFIYNDLPRFIMDSYEECRDPPRLHLLDKFDTGGPGSCLKRYSDPTFFRKVSGSAVKASAEKVQRDKKARKSKKKRTSQRNGEISRGAPISDQSGRFQLTSSIVNGPASSSQTASTVDMTLKSDQGDHSNSFDSRTGSGYIECVFDISSSMQPGEQESKESSSRLIQHVGTLDSVCPDEQTKVLDDTFSHSSSPEQTAPNSSCVTWDEKVEIVEPNCQHCGKDEIPEMLPTNFDLDTQDSGAVTFGIVDQMDILLGDEDSPKSISSMGLLDEIESEPDNYMDALNTIESESETDLDCQTKREVEQYSSNVKIDRTEDGLPELMAHSSVHHPPNVESQTASSISSDNRMSWNLPDSVPSESSAHEQTPQISGKSSDSDHSPGANFCASADILDGSRVESIISEPSSSGSRISNIQDPSVDRKESSLCESQESHTDFSGVQSIKFWTNGGLLGLEPSKPPDFAVSNAGRQDFVTRSRDGTVGTPNHTFILKGDRQKGKLGALVENAENTEKVSLPSTDVGAKLGKSVDSRHSNRFDHAYMGGLNVTGIVAPTSELPVDPDVKAKSIEANQENDGNSSGVFGLGHRLLVNGFRRKVSLVHDGKSEPASSHGGKSESASSLTAGVFEQRSGNHSFAYQTISETTFKEQFGLGSPVNSLTSSPPLEHMKISFNPIDGLETSKLKLKFPDGSHCHESIRDMFPSFQLVPEPAIPLHDIGSDSDDDTFCRSSPYMSDDVVSHHSESDSEQWESGETPGSNDHDLYDALCRISSMESLSSSVQLGGTANDGIYINGELKSTYTENGAETSLSDPLLDLPSFDAVNAIVEGERENNSDLKNLLNSQNSREPTPTPPPLPPVQWRVLKSQSDVAEDKQDAVSQALEPAFDLKLLGSSISQQPKPTPSKQQHTNEEVVAFKPDSKVSWHCQDAVSQALEPAFDLKVLGSSISQQPKPTPSKQQHTNEEVVAFKPDSKQSDQQKLSGQKESDQAANGKGMDEKEDFLQQIRTKSFNLRRTVTTRPTVTPSPTTNVSVTAILEKANAIRQAVGSDDGDDDDNWSDT